MAKMIKKLANIIVSNQVKLNKLCVAGAADSFIQAGFFSVAGRDFPHLNILLENSPDFMDSLLESKIDPDLFFQQNYLEIKKIEQILKTHYSSLHKRVSNKYPDYDYSQVNKITNDLFINKSHNILNNIIPRFAKMFKSYLNNQLGENYNSPIDPGRYSSYMLKDIIDPDYLEEVYQKAKSENKTDVIEHVLINPNTPQWILDECVGKSRIMDFGIAANSEITHEQALRLLNKYIKLNDDRFLEKLSRNKGIHKYPDVIDELVKFFTSNTFVLNNILDNNVLNQDNLLNIINNCNSSAIARRALLHRSVDEDFLNRVIKESINRNAIHFAESLLKQNKEPL